MTTPPPVPGTSQATTAPAVAPNAYGSFGIAPGISFPPIDRALLMLLGMPGCGKSTLLQSAGARTLIINSDLCPSYNPYVQMYPAWKGGQLLDHTGSPFVLTFKHIRELVERLVKAATENLPRPTIVAFDSLRTLVQLARDFTITSFNKTEWRELDGRAGYDFMYDAIINLILRLRSAGYGVVLVAHIVNRVIPIGDDVSVEKIDVDITPGLYSRLYGMTDLQMVIAREDVPVSRTVEQEIKLPDGKVVTRKNVVETMEKRWLAIADVAEPGQARYSGVMKRRAKITKTLNITAEGGGWDVLTTAYNEAIANHNPASR